MFYAPDYQHGIIIVAGKQQRSFAHTYANWREVQKLPSELENREPDYPSKRGSLYWYTNSGVYRKSDHWGYGIGTCDWLLDGQTYDGIISKIGYCRWDDFVDLERISMRKKAYDGGLQGSSIGAKDTILVPQDSMYATVYEEFAGEWAWIVGYMGDTVHDGSGDVFESWEDAVVDLLNNYGDEYGYLFEGAPFLNE